MFSWYIYKLNIYVRIFYAFAINTASFNITEYQMINNIYSKC